MRDPGPNGQGRSALAAPFGEPLATEDRPGTRQDLDEVFRLHAAGRTRGIHETRPLETVNGSIADLLDGRIKARVVFEMGSGSASGVAGRMSGRPGRSRRWSAPNGRSRVATADGGPGGRGR
ncbi:hypothetical protein [Streptomyces luteogriseus]|uniref:hypothetical protein n=1 Tax=Streptomyces luteogriseus TaxID=68233 RepID=UPI0037AA9C7C